MLDKIKSSIPTLLILLLVVFVLGSLTGKIKLDSIFKGKEETDKVPATEIDQTLWDKLVAEHPNSNPNAKATLVEFGDFQCPACQKFHTIYKQLDPAYLEKVNLVFVNFPLEKIHDRARYAARSAVAVEKQGKFFDYHDMLYDAQESWTTTNFSDSVELFVPYVTSLGLDVNKFKEDYQSRSVKDFVNNDLKTAEDLNLGSTPSLFINKKSVKVSDLESLKKVIDEAQN